MAGKIDENGKPAKRNAGPGGRAAGSHKDQTGAKTGPGQRLTPAGPRTEAPGKEEAGNDLSNQNILEGLDLPGYPPPETPDEAFNVTQEVTAQPSPEEKTATYRLTPAARKLAQKEAKQTALIILTMIDGLVCMFYGSSASMNDYEREMMEPPLERMLMRLDIVSAEALSKWSDPLLFLMGLTAWISRVTREKDEAKARKEAEPPPEVTQAKDNGRPARTPKNPNPPPGSPAADILLTEALTAPKALRDQIKGDRIE